MLNLSMVSWKIKDGDREVLKEAIEFNVPMRYIRTDPQVRAGVVGLQTTERYKAISDVLSRPIGEFQANRFLTFPAMLDTRAISVLVEAVRSSTGTLRDEAAYVRCTLLSELVLDPAKVTRSDKDQHQHESIPVHSPDGGVHAGCPQRQGGCHRPDVFFPAYDEENRDDGSQIENVWHRHLGLDNGGGPDPDGVRRYMSVGLVRLKLRDHPVLEPSGWALCDVEVHGA